MPARKVKKKKREKKRKKISPKIKPKAKKVAIRTKPKTTSKKKQATKKPVSKKPVVKKTTKPKSSVKKETISTSIAVRKLPHKKAEEERKAALRKVLIKKREEILKEAKKEISNYIKGETRQLVDTALDDGDWSVIDLSEDISLKKLSTHRENLQKIDEALRKLNEGTYGICEDCGEEISEERLKIVPFAIYCIDCQERREQLEEFARKEGLG